MVELALLEGDDTEQVVAFHGLNQDQIIREYEARRKREQRAKRKVAEGSCEDMVDIVKRAKIAKDIVRYILKQTNAMGMDTKKDIFNRMIQHPALKDFQNEKAQQTGFTDKLIANIRNTLQDLKRPQNEEEMFVKRSVMMMLVGAKDSQEEQGVNVSAASKLLSVHRRNLYGARYQLQQIEMTASPFSSCHRRPYGSRIPEEVKEQVANFWTLETRVSPNKKDICRKRIGRKQYIEHPIHLLEVSQVELYQRFNAAYPDVSIGLRAFESEKPYFVRKLKDRLTCCCIYHVQISYLKESINQMRSQAFGEHGGMCKCACPICADSSLVGTCSATKYNVKSITELIDSLLCPKQPGSTYHGLNCHMGNCTSCGANKFLCCPKELLKDARIIKVKLFKDVETGDGEGGKKKKRKELICQEMSTASLLRVFKMHLQKFIKHDFVYRWQAEQFKACILQFPEDVVVSVVDFAENYSFNEQNEIQSMHWYSTQVTIFVHITYYRVGGVAKKTLHFFISDDKMHDTLFVQHCFMLHWQWIKDKGLDVSQHWVWSDGAASQFKAKRPFYFVGRYAGLTGKVMVWNFFGSGHGKGEHDGAGAVVKRALTHEQLKSNGAVLKCAADVVQFLRRDLSTDGSIADGYPSNHRQVDRVFWEIKLGEVSRENSWDCEVIPKTRSMHSVRGYSKKDGSSIAYRELSCYCSACMRNQWRKCSNKTHVSSWSFQKITQSIGGNRDDISEDPAYEGHYEPLVRAIQEGDNFAVNAEEGNNEGVDFYLIKCTSTLEILKAHEKDSWGTMFEAGSHILKGLYYKQVGDYSYKLLSRRPVLMYSHLVRCIKIPMTKLQGATELYEISPEVFESVYNSMPWEM